MRKYEGKLANTRLDVVLSAPRHVSAANCRFGGTSLLFILAGKSFSDIFTTYSHALYSRPRQRA